jgi:hypothetical protein
VTFSDLGFVNTVPMQTYAVSSFLQDGSAGGTRISLLTCLSIDETVARLKDPEQIHEQLGIEVGSFERKAACFILEFVSDDVGRTWQREEHRGICDRVYQRNSRDFYVSFMNMIGQVRRFKSGPFAGQLVLDGPVTGDCFPCDDRSRFRDYTVTSSVITSNDNGKSWQFGRLISDDEAFNHSEASAVPVDGGRRLCSRCGREIALG